MYSLTNGAVRKMLIISEADFDEDADVKDQRATLQKRLLGLKKQKDDFAEYVFNTLQEYSNVSMGIRVPYNMPQEEVKKTYIKALEKLGTPVDEGVDQETMHELFVEGIIRKAEETNRPLEELFDELNKEVL